MKLTVLFGLFCFFRGAGGGVGKQECKEEDF